MTVGSFDPGARLETALSVENVEALVALAETLPTDDAALDGWSLAAAEAERFAPFAMAQPWADQLQKITSDQLIGLIRLFTLGEEKHPAWSAGEKSCVIVFARELKRRGDYDASLTRWIKSHSHSIFPAS